MNNEAVIYIDRRSGEKKKEKVYYDSLLRFLYGKKLGWWIATLSAKVSFFSSIYGFFQKRKCSRKKISPFVERYEVDLSDFEIPSKGYRSFNDFFIRKLKPNRRSLAEGVIIPADGRYLVYQNIEKCDGFIVKGQKFSLSQLLDDEKQAAQYKNGAMAIARLCPTDYHRFHFLCDTTAGPAKLINGPLYSVNPLAIKKNIELLSKNKRMITELQTEKYGTILFIEIGATNVGSIKQTYMPLRPYKKGDEKGYFSFGGSSLIILFNSDQFTFDQDLLDNSSQHVETLCLFGQSLGK